MAPLAPNNCWYRVSPRPTGLFSLPEGGLEPPTTPRKYTSFRDRSVHGVAPCCKVWPPGGQRPGLVGGGAAREREARFAMVPEPTAWSPSRTRFRATSTVPWSTTTWSAAIRAIAPRVELQLRPYAKPWASPSYRLKGPTGNQEGPEGVEPRAARSLPEELGVGEIPSLYTQAIIIPSHLRPSFLPR